MHDHLRDMGQRIVREERAFQGTRIWMPEAYELLKNDEVCFQMHEALLFQCGNIIYVFY